MAGENDTIKMLEYFVKYTENRYIVKTLMQYKRFPLKNKNSSIVDRNLNEFYLTINLE